jgi:lipid II:glycine glycyltransferase (peptidoglycan interpeptide bridge formation enzyme)
MRKGRRSDLKLARRTLRVTWTDGDDRDGKSHLDRFFALYEETMVSHRADDFYRFPRSYFSSLTSLGRRFGIAFAWLDNQLAAASLFLAGREFAHYHLAASNEVGMEHGAATLLIVEGAKWARDHGCKLLHLGGGVNPGDSLEDFKYSFGGELYRYASLVSIIDPERFQQLSRMPNAPWPYRLNET